MIGAPLNSHDCNTLNEETLNEETSGIGSLIRSYIDNHAPLLFLHLDCHGQVIATNRFTREVTGIDFTGKDYRSVFLFTDKKTDTDKKTGANNMPDLASLRKEPKKFHLLNVGTRANMPETFRTHFFALDDKTGANETLVFGSLDADESMQLRLELISLNSRLNNLTRELQKKNHELDKLNQLKNQFLGMAAHDLRKPVSSILAYTEFLIDEATPALSAEHAGFLQTIHASTGLMRQVIDDFLDIAMIESGRFDLSLATTDLCASVEASAAMIHPLAKKRGIAITITRDCPIPQVMADGMKIGQVLNNLLSNAIEHSPPDSTVGIWLFCPAGGVAVTVSDSGPGISADERAALFKPFASGNNSKPSGCKRTGLGLAISKKIIEAHGGRIWIEDSSDKKGTAFTFFLPLAAEEVK